MEDRNAVPALVEEMRAAMRLHEGIGIAAPQIGKPLRIFLIARDLFPAELQVKISSDVFVNPKLVRKSFKRTPREEGCLSVPRVFGEVPRASRVIIEAENLAGKKIRITASDLLAQVLQHELDHLEGVLFVDKAKTTTLHEILADGTIKPWTA